MAASHGPQQERLGFSWKQTDIGRPSSREETPILNVSKEQQLLQQISQLRRENEYLRDYATRSTKELGRFQAALPDVGQREVHGDDEEPLPPWVVNSQYVSPLLLAYDQRISELEQQNSKYQDELQMWQDEVKRVVDQNEQLQAELAQNVQQLLKRQVDSLDSLPLGVTATHEERQELQERIDLLTEENSMLVEQNEMVKRQLDQLGAENHARTNECIEKTNALAHTTALLDAAEGREQEQRRLREIAEQKLKQCLAELGTLEREKEDLVRDLNRATSELKLQTAAATSYKRSFDELQNRSEAESQQLLQELQNANSREKELTQRSMHLERMMEEWKEKYRVASREQESARHEFESMLKVMDGLERQVGEYQHKEQSTLQLAQESKERVEQAMLERDQAVARAQNAEKNVTRVQEKMKKELTEQRHASDKVMESIREKLKRQLESREEEIRTLDNKITDLQTALERSARDRQSLESQLQGVNQAHKQELNRLQKLVEESDMRAHAVLAEKEEALRREDRTVYEVREKERQWRLKETEMERALQDKQKEVDMLTRTVDALKQEQTKLRQDMKETYIERDQFREELDRTNRSLNQQTDQMMREAMLKISALESGLKEAEHSKQRSESRAVELLTAQEKVGQRWREEHHSTVQHFERAVNDLKQENRRLAVRNEEMSSKLSALLNERSSILADQDRVSKVEETLKRQVELLEKRLGESTTQLTSSIQTDQTRLQEVQQLRIQVEKSERERERLSRQLESANNRIEELRNTSLSNRFVPLTTV
eukprot:GILJ01008031.1.p1 GENE.GILJ01008031.1~~GILJ01008031.1.p1  ORF type:complete len:794 (-),score=180.63 GILJ01008031.1:59-2395(-)